MAEDLRDAWEQRLLAEAAAAFRYPATPPVGAAVRRRLSGAPPAVAAPRRRYALAGAVAFAAVAVTVALVLAASASTRDAVADFLGLGVRGERIEPLPGRTATPFASPVPLDEVARRVSLAEAAAAAGFAPVLPSGAGEPAAVYLVEQDEVVLVVLSYPGFDLWQARFRGQSFLKQYLSRETIVETVNVEGHAAYWLEGGRHIVAVLDAEGREVAGTRRTVDRNTLVWFDGRANYRLETSLPLAQALEVAESLPASQ
jgi:hypothetical protein